MRLHLELDLGAATNAEATAEPREGVDKTAVLDFVERRAQLTRADTGRPDSAHQRRGDVALEPATG